MKTMKRLRLFSLCRAMKADTKTTLNAGRHYVQEWIFRCGDTVRYYSPVEMSHFNGRIV